jgi:hypothetical protein
MAKNYKTPEFLRGIDDEDDVPVRHVDRPANSTVRSSRGPATPVRGSKSNVLGTTSGGRPLGFGHLSILRNTQVAALSNMAAKSAPSSSGLGALQRVQKTPSAPPVRRLTEGEVATRLGISPKTLRNWRSRKEGPEFIKFGRLVRYRLIDVIAFEKATWTGNRRGGVHENRNARPHFPRSSGFSKAALSKMVWPQPAVLARGQEPAPMHEPQKRDRGI